MATQYRYGNLFKKMKENTAEEPFVSNPTNREAPIFKRKTSQDSQGCKAVLFGIVDVMLILIWVVNMFRAMEGTGTTREVLYLQQENNTEKNVESSAKEIHSLEAPKSRVDSVDSDWNSLKHFHSNTAQERTWKYGNTLVLMFVTTEKVIKEIRYSSFYKDQENVRKHIDDMFTENSIPLRIEKFLPSTGYIFYQPVFSIHGCTVFNQSR